MMDLEDVKKGLETLKALEDYPKLEKENNILRQQVRELKERNQSLEETSIIIENNTMTMQQLNKHFLKIKS